MEQSSEHIPSAQPTGAAIGQQQEEREPGEVGEPGEILAPQHGAHEVADRSAVAEGAKGAVKEEEESARKLAVSKVKVEYDEDNKKTWQWLDEYDVQTVWVDQDSRKSSKVKLELEEGEADVIYEKREGEGGEGGEEGEDEYYVVEEEEIIEEGVEDAHSEGMTNIDDEEMREEHLQAIKVHRKRKDFEVFVGGLDW